MILFKLVIEPVNTNMNDDRLDAHNEIVSRLQEFNEDDQKHILNMVCQWFKVSVEPKAPIRPYVAESDLPEASVGLFSQKSDLTPKDFLTEKEPQSNVERVACLAYYLNHYRETPSFKTLDISKLNTEAAQPKFANSSVAVNDAITSGFVVASTKGTKKISTMGEQFVLALPDRDEAKKIKQRMRLKKKNKSAAKENRAQTERK